MKNVLWLTSWYPNRLDKFDGDFIQRHAGAVSLFCKVYVIYVKKDESLKPNKVETEISESGNLTEHILYYNTAKTGIALLDKYVSFRLYKKCFQNAITAFINKSGKPDIAHVQVAMKAGVAAIWLKRKWNIPYLITEHWTAYLKDADYRVEQQSYSFKRLLNRVINNASSITVVSDFLGRSMQWYFPEMKYKVIPNVVDTRLFYPLNIAANKTTRFVHVSNMNFQKNTESIIEALFHLNKSSLFEMYLYGPVQPHLINLVYKYELQHCVFVKGELPQPEIAKAIQQADALVLFSRFETFGCVLIEAGACGVPVIVSDLNVFHEIVDEDVNGIFAKKDDPLFLAEKLKLLIDGELKFDKSSIAAETAAKFNYKRVGEQFADEYKRVTACFNQDSLI